MINSLHNKTRKKAFAVCAILSGLLMASAILCVATGPVELSRRILYIRIIRVLLGLAVGAGLATCGAVFQALFRNPLAEPFILGISSGAGLGLVLFAIVFSSTIFLPLPAFAGACATILLVYNLAKIGQKTPVQSLLLAGVVVNIVFSSMILFLISTAKNAILHDAAWWLLGNLQVFDIKVLAITAVATITGIAVFLAYTRELNAISIGEEDALHLGIDVEKTKRILFVTTSLVTAVIVSTCGLIGFAGLIVPHIARALVGPNHKTLIPTTAILGAAFLILSDALGRIVIQPVEIPIGVITSFLGGPFFLFLLKRSGRIRMK